MSHICTFVLFFHPSFATDASRPILRFSIPKFNLHHRPNSMNLRPAPCLCVTNTLGFPLANS
ncbi:hypothetical protein C8R44DRAFT_798815 [Mycena epipterygia]|nr:hypothetical protein C8R44DRAFT_798815 [Mycena epipterygia]